MALINWSWFGTMLHRAVVNRFGQFGVFGCCCNCVGCIRDLYPFVCLQLHLYADLFSALFGAGAPCWKWHKQRWLANWHWHLCQAVRNVFVAFCILVISMCSIALALLGPTTYNSIRSILYPNKGFIKYCMALLGPAICKVFLVFFILKKFCKVFHCHS